MEIDFVVNRELWHVEIQFLVQLPKQIVNQDFPGKTIVVSLKPRGQLQTISSRAVIFESAREFFLAIVIQTHLNGFNLDIEYCFFS